MNIFLTNDDGIEAAGLRTLVAGLKQDANVFVVAPATERSAASHSISLGQKLRVEESLKGGVLEYKVHGTPADCVKFALSELRHLNPDLVISGVNQGANTGVSVYYSGTISAAREAVINGVPAMAVSLCSKDFNDFSVAVAVVQQLVAAYEHEPFPKGVLLNVNVPAVPPNKVRGMRLTKQAVSRFIEEFVKEGRSGGGNVYTLAGEIELMDPDGSSDEEAIREGFVSITPLKLDLTDYATMRCMEGWLKPIFEEGEP